MICAPIRHTVGIDGTIEEKRLHSHSNVVDDVQRQQQRNNSIAGLRRVTSWVRLVVLMKKVPRGWWYQKRRRVVVQQLVPQLRYQICFSLLSKVRTAMIKGQVKDWYQLVATLQLVIFGHNLGGTRIEPFLTKDIIKLKNYISLPVPNNFYLSTLPFAWLTFRISHWYNLFQVFSSCLLLLSLLTPVHHPFGSKETNCLILFLYFFPSVFILMFIEYLQRLDISFIGIDGLKNVVKC